MLCVVPVAVAVTVRCGARAVSMRTVASMSSGQVPAAAGGRVYAMYTQDTSAFASEGLLQVVSSVEWSTLRTASDLPPGPDRAWRLQRNQGTCSGCL